MKCHPLSGLALVGSLLPLSALAAQGGAIGGRIIVPKTNVTGVVVYLVPLAAPGAPVAAPDSAEINQLHLRFEPGIIAITPGSTVTFRNSDPMLHNVFHPGGRGAFNLGTYAQGEQRSHTFPEEGAFVIFCSVHPEMVAYVVVVDAPYRTVADAAGRFQLEGIVPGRYRLSTWHRRLATRNEIVTIPSSGTVHLDLVLKPGSPDTPHGRP